MIQEKEHQLDNLDKKNKIGGTHLMRIGIIEISVKTLFIKFNFRILFSIMRYTDMTNVC